ncbi:efflux RND transporter periplasmic adaptor subunit [bacterium]|nr:efflux RND transporter periplasmic adaptor subunit [bacterium]NIN91854.1 efflux RND transporter periplasmic adaptor subunit [bacterium]NIO18128.1 efflux RND transporter periplasmic adaptor subunit [bacterium]NIO73100.1 efflux RND transporter periplasmic adaptor subunit [bacterium]
MKGKSVVLIVVLLVVSLVGYRIIRYNIAKRNIKDFTEEKVTFVKTVPAGRGDIEEIIYLNGDIRGLREVDVYTRVSGKLIKKIKEEGESVRKGEVVALIDRDEPALGFTKAEVKAPIKGTVIRYYVDIGDSVIPQEPMPQEPVVNIAYMDRVKIVVNVGEKDIAKLRKGEKVRVSVDAYPGENFLGQVVKVAPAVDPRSRKLKVELEIENKDHRLKPGMFADVEIIYNEHSNVLVVPRIAILEKEGKEILFTVEGSRARLKEVKIGIGDEEKIEIFEGLTEGESVVIEGNYGLTDGAKVEVGGI